MNTVTLLLEQTIAPSAVLDALRSAFGEEDIVSVTPDRWLVHDDADSYFLYVSTGEYRCDETIVANSVWMKLVGDVLLRSYEIDVEYCSDEHLRLALAAICALATRERGSLYAVWGFYWATELAELRAACATPEGFSTAVAEFRDAADRAPEDEPPSGRAWLEQVERMFPWLGIVERDSAPAQLGAAFLLASHEDKAAFIADARRFERIAKRRGARQGLFRVGVLELFFTRSSVSASTGYVGPMHHAPLLVLPIDGAPWQGEGEAARRQLEAEGGDGDRG
jgi:hypothetical protein